MRPEERNGIILGYKVNYWTGMEQKETVNVPDSSAREIELSRLKFLTDYKMEVIAYTGAGDGPASAVVTATTDESSKIYFNVGIILKMLSLECCLSFPYHAVPNHTEPYLTIPHVYLSSSCSRPGNSRSIQQKFNQDISTVGSHRCTRSTRRSSGLSYFLSSFEH